MRRKYAQRAPVVVQFEPRPRCRANRKESTLDSARRTTYAQKLLFAEHGSHPSSRPGRLQPMRGSLTFECWSSYMLVRASELEAFRLAEFPDANARSQVSLNLSASLRSRLCVAYRCLNLFHICDSRPYLRMLYRSDRCKRGIRHKAGGTRRSGRGPYR
jgi:hypothetical protein